MGDDGGGFWDNPLVELATFGGAFIGLAIVCDDHMVVALETLCVRWNVPEDVAGASFLAIGSAAPEIVINAIGVYKSHKASAGGQATSVLQQREANSALQLGLSAIIGSGMIAFLLAPAICALGAKQILKLKRRPLAKNILFYDLSLFALCWFFKDGIVDIKEATFMLVIYAGYIVVTFFGPMAMRKYTVYMYGPLPRDMIQQNFVEKAREEQRALQAANSSQMTGVGGGGGGSAEQEEEEDDEPEPEPQFLSLEWWLAAVPRVFRLVFSTTCPDCSEGAPREAWYPVTLAISFLWVTIFSGAISGIVGRWEEKLGVSTIILGITLVAVGGEVPDTIQSLAVAKKGYGSLAVANCLGAQVANIGFGLGLPWFLSALWDEPVALNGHAEVQTLVWFHVIGISIFTFITLGLVVMPLFYSKPIEPKATLTPSKGLVLIVAYIVIVISYVITCQMNSAMSLNLSFGATQLFFLIVIGGIAAAAWTSRRMRLRHQAELKKAGLLPGQMQSEFYRMKFKRETEKVKASPAPSTHPTPNASPPHGNAHGDGSGGNGSDGLAAGGGAFPRAAAGGREPLGSADGYDMQEVSWEDDDAEAQELDPLVAVTQAISEAETVEELTDAVYQIQQQAAARARAKGMSSGYAAMSNSLLRKALKA